MWTIYEVELTRFLKLDGEEPPHISKGHICNSVMYSVAYCRTNPMQHSTKNNKIKRVVMYHNIYC